MYDSTGDQQTRVVASPAGQRTRIRRAVVLVVAGAVAVGIGLAILLPRYQLHTVPTTAMAPTIAAGQVVIADNSAARGTELRRGEVVRIVPDGWDDVPPGLTFTVRVVGVGGDVVACCDAGRLTVNGEVVDEPYTDGRTDAYGDFRVEVPPGRVFVLGDARDVAVDSRTHVDTDQGTLAAGDVQSRAEAVVWPLWKAGPVNHTGAFGEPASGGPVPAYLVGMAAATAGLVLWLVAAARPTRRAWSWTLAKLPVFRGQQREW